MGFFGGGRGRGSGGDRGDLGPPPDPFRLPERREFPGGGQRRLLGILAAHFRRVAEALILMAIDFQCLWVPHNTNGACAVGRLPVMRRISRASPSCRWMKGSTPDRCCCDKNC